MLATYCNDKPPPANGSCEAQMRVDCGPDRGNETQGQCLQCTQNKTQMAAAYYNLQRAGCGFKCRSPFDPVQPCQLSDPQSDPRVKDYCFERAKATCSAGIDAVCGPAQARDPCMCRNCVAGHGLSQFGCDAAVAAAICAEVLPPQSPTPAPPPVPTPPPTPYNITPPPPPYPGEDRMWDGTCFACDRYPEMATYDLPDLDWVAKGAVNPVPQIRCASCGLFAAVSDVECAWYMAGNNLTKLSEQELLDCVPGGGPRHPNNCAGGERFRYYTWMEVKGGISTTARYPFTSGRPESCKKNLIAVDVPVTGWVRVRRSTTTRRR